eukprot:scaffold330178_cov97-Tisochrysis_lutea.AAC.2
MVWSREALVRAQSTIVVSSEGASRDQTRENPHAPSHPRDVAATVGVDRGTASWAPTVRITTCGALAPKLEICFATATSSHRAAGVGASRGLGGSTAMITPVHGPRHRDTSSVTLTGWMASDGQDGRAMSIDTVVGGTACRSQR